mgnify:CR=1 FL=1
MDWLLFFQIAGGLILTALAFGLVMLFFAWLADRSELAAVLVCCVVALLLVTWFLYSMAVNA